MANTNAANRDFRPFIPECNRRGLGKTKAYELAKDGLLETFTIGSKRYVLIESLDSLPQRLQDLSAASGAAK